MPATCQRVAGRSSRVNCGKPTAAATAHGHQGAMQRKTAPQILILLLERGEEEVRQWATVSGGEGPGRGGAMCALVHRSCAHGSPRVCVT